jgi:predicted HTH domain antitoxin
MMVAARLSPVYDDLLEYLVKKASPQEILAFQPSEAARARAIELIEKSSEGELSAEERAELAQMRQIDSFVSVLKARALEAIHGV